MAVLAILVTGALWYRGRSAARSEIGPPHGSDAAASRPAGCDGQAPPPLPEHLTPAGTSIEAIVDALDKTLADDHKRALRCFADEDDLLAHAQGGFGAWLRTTLHLWSRNDTTKAFAAIGLTNADAMSEVLMRVYFHRLRGQALAIDQTVGKVRAAAKVAR